MKIKLHLALLLLLVSLHVSAQETMVIGKVITADTKQPVGGAVVFYGMDQNAVTEDDGTFRISRSENGVVHIQCLSYLTKVVTAESIRKGEVIELDPSPVQLAEVVVVPINISQLLAQAVYNTKSRLVTGRSYAYKVNMWQSERNKKEQQGIEAKYVASLKKADPDKDKIPYQLELLELKHTHTLPKWLKATSLRNQNMKADCHWLNFNLSTGGKNFETTISTTDSLYIITERSKKDEFRDAYENVYAINRADTTISFAQKRLNLTTFTEDNVPFHKRKSFKFRFEILHIKGSFIPVGDGRYVLANHTQSVETALHYHVGGKEYVTHYLESNLISTEPVVGKPRAKKKFNGEVEQLFKMANLEFRGMKD